MSLSGEVRKDDPGEPTTGLPRVSIAPDEIDILCGLGRGKRVLEIGSGYGVSTAALARHAASVWTVDPDPPALEAIYQLSKMMTNVYPSPTVDYLDGPFDLAFIDGDHNDLSVASDIADCLSRLRTGGLLVLHDALAGNVMQGASLAGISVFVLPTTYGLGFHVKT